MKAPDRRELPRYVDTKQLAEMFQISEWTVMRKKKSGEWPHVQIGRLVRFDLDVILRAHRPPRAPKTG